MPKGLKVVLAVLVLLVAVFATWLLTRPHEPEYQRRRLSDWLDDYNRASSWDKTEPASAAIRAMGTNCLPFLLEHIKRNPSRLVIRAVALFNKQRLVKLPIYGVDRYRSASIVALSALGPQATPLCPELLGLTKVPSTGWWANMSLLAIGTDSIPFLELACQNTNQDGVDAVLMIAMMKATPAPHFGWGWSKAPLNGKPVLGLGYAVSSESVRQIANMLEHPSPSVRRASADALSRYTGATYTEVLKSTVPLLIKTCGDSNDAVRTSAAATLKLIDPTAAAKAGIK
ncbi:MAG TPA: HEAT repeat domain-containing protein [Candidatus Dormibacteraeota bacterium]|nr:HEAT repeat domain-containing protein [Candidatus Dormibacteraeota bacterium]